MTQFDPTEIGSLGLPLSPVVRVNTKQRDLTWTIRHTSWEYLHRSEDGAKLLPRIKALHETLQKSEKNDPKNGLWPTNFEDFSIWYVYYANCHSKEDADAVVQKYIDADTFESLISLWVIGIEVDSCIELVDDFHIFPISEMPLSTDRERFRTEIGEIGFDQPKCAIVKRVTVSKSNPRDGRPFADILAKMQTISNIICLIRGVVCSPILQSNTTLDCPAGSPFSGGGKLYTRHQFIENFTRLDVQQLQEIRELFSAWNSQNPKTQQLLSRSMYRLSLAKLNQYIGDKFLDLSIALEMLLLNDNTNHVQLSLSFRLHGALLLGGDLETKTRHQKMFYEIYNHRSSMAHAGKMSSNKDRRPFTKNRDEDWILMFSEFEEVAENCIKRIIYDGLPNWNKLRLGSDLAIEKEA